MKPNEQMLFGNIFNDVRIVPKYLERFAEDHLAKLVKNNGDNSLNNLITTLRAALNPFKEELGDVETSYTTLEGKTLTVDTFIENFVSYMKNKYIPIAAKLGGDKTPEFIAFYPKGKTEYNRITKTQIPTLMSRINTAAAEHATALGTEITTQLQTFKTQWASLRETQLQGKAALKTNREERSTTRVNVELVLLSNIHAIGNKYPGNVDMAMLFFDFTLLFGKGRGGATKEAPPEGGVK